MLPAAQSVFRNRSFRLFYAGQAFSYAGDGLRLIAIPLLVYHLTGSAVSIGVTYALELGPFALFGLLGGSLADRLDRRGLMLACDATRFVVMALFALAVALHALTLAEIYGGIVLLSIAAAIFNGGQASSLPFLVGKARATQATAALLVADQTSQTVLPPIGGALFALLGPLPALIANAVTYLLSQASLLAIETLGPTQPSGLPSFADVRRDIALGYRFAWRDPAMRALTACSFLLNFFGFMVLAVFIPFLKRDFGTSDAVVGYALGLGALGAIGGSLVAGRIPANWPFGRVLLFALLLDGVAFLPVMFAHRLAIVVAFLALTNACALFETAQIVGWRMRVTPEDMVGRVFGAVRFVVLIGSVPGALVGGYLADRYGARLPIVVAGAGYFAAALVVAMVPAVRRERR